MNLIDDVHFVVSLCRPIADFLHDLTNIIDAVVGSSVDLDNIHGSSCRDSAAGSTFIAWISVYRMFTVDDLRHYFGNRRLSRSSRTAEEICMLQPSRPDLIL